MCPAAAARPHGRSKSGLVNIFSFYFTQKVRQDLPIAIGHHPLHHGSPTALYRRT